MTQCFPQDKSNGKKEDIAGATYMYIHVHVYLCEGQVHMHAPFKFETDSEQLFWV